MKDNYNDINDDLLVKYLLGEATAGEERLVEEWIDRDDFNQKYYEHFRLIWEESKRLSISSTIDEDIAWQRFHQRIHGTVAGTGPVKQLNRLPWLRIAALMVVLAGAAVLTYTLFRNKQPVPLAVESKNRVLIDTLSDGSVVTLNKNSRLSYPSTFKGNTRTITLKGEAFFAIAPDKRKPFIINVNDVHIKVVGTSFNVKSINGNTEVIVETGIVQVTRDNKNIELRPAEKITVKKEDAVLVKEISTDKLYNYFRSKEFECDNTPLWKLVQALNEAYDADIAIENKDLRNQLLTTTFNNESLDHILLVIRETFNISVIKTGNHIILK